MTRLEAEDEETPAAGYRPSPSDSSSPQGTAGTAGTTGTANASMTPSRRMSWGDAWGPLTLLVGVVVLANALYLLGVFHPDPLGTVSDLVSSSTPGVLPGMNTIDPNSGFTAQALGHLAALDLLHGHLPWWNPFEGVGAPLAGEMQSAALFPLTPLLALPDGQLPFHLLLELTSGIAAWRLGVRLGIAPWIAGAAGCAFALDGTFSWFEHAPVNAIAFAPMLLLGIERARSSTLSGTRHRWALIAIALALSLYAGFPEVAYLDGLLAVVWMLARAWGLQGAQLLRYARKLIAGTVVGLALAAPILVAFLDYLRAAYLGGHSSGFNGLALPHAGIAQLLFPYLFGPIFGFDTTSPVLGVIWGNVGGYLSTTLLLLCIVGCWSRRLRALRVGLVIWIVLGISRIYGFAPLVRLFDLLPDMRQVAAFRYLPPSVELAAVVLAALAVDDIRCRVVPGWYILVALSASVAAALGALDASRGIVTALGRTSHTHQWVLASLIWGFGAMAVVAIAAFAFRGRARVGLLVGCMVVDALAMFVVPELSAPRHVSVDSGLVQAVRQETGDGRFFTLGPFQPNYGSYYEVGELDVNDLPIPSRYAHYIATHLDSNIDPNIFIGTISLHPTGPGPIQELESYEANYETAGVRDIVAPSGLLTASQVRAMGLTFVYGDALADVYRLPQPAPLYSVVHGSCTLSHETVSGVISDCRGPATIERRELYMAGWSETAVTGTTTSATTTTSAVSSFGPLFQSVQVGSGSARLAFSFAPPHEDAALGALIVGVLLLLASWWLGSTGRRVHVHRPQR